MSDHSHPEKAGSAIDRNVYRKGFNTFLVLAVLTVVEYFVGLWFPSAVLLILLAIAKAALVLNIFMGITKLWRGGDHH